MENYRRNGNKNGGQGFKGGFDNRSFDKPMYRATCAKCGNSCEVPFRPNGSKPVYCRDCFKKDDAPMAHRTDRDFGGRPFEEKRLYQAVCDTCGDNCEVPFRPTGERPVYCRNCFRKDGGTSGHKDFKHSAPVGDDRVTAQLAQINAKLDAIMRSLAPSAPKAEAKPVAAVVPTETASKKAAKKKAVGKKK